MTEREELSELFGKRVVVDTRAPCLYLGTLEDYTDSFLTLRDVDVHDMADSRGTKELYVMNARQHGIQPNRAAVKVRLDIVISISLLSDVLVYD